MGKISNGCHWFSYDIYVDIWSILIRYVCFFGSRYSFAKKINSLIIILGYIDVSILKLFEMLKQNIKICWNYFTYSFF